MDAENYSSYPDSQFEEDNVLRELNKCLLAFRQNTTCPIIPKNAPRRNRRMNSMPSIESHDSEQTKDKERINVQRRFVASKKKSRKNDENSFFSNCLQNILDFRRLEKVDVIHQKT